MIDLLIQDKRGNIIKHQLGPGKHRLGKSPTADIVVVDPYVSRHHVDVIVTEEAIYLKDLESLNGTWVQGQRIQPTARLMPGSLFRIGQSDCLLETAYYVYCVKEGRAYDPEELHAQNEVSELPANVLSIHSHRARHHN